MVNCFSPGLTPDSFPSQKLGVYLMGAIKTGLPAGVMQLSAGATSTPTMATKGSQAEGKPQPVHEALRKASITCHSPRET